MKQGDFFGLFLGFLSITFRFHADALALGFFQLFVAGIAFGAHGLNATGKVPMQAVAAVQLKAQEPRAVIRAGGFGIITGVAALEPDIVQHQRLAAERAAHLIQRRVIFVGIVVQAVKVGLDIVRFGIGIVQQGGCQLGGGVRIFGNALGQRQAAADFCGVQGIVQRIVEIAVMLNAKAVHHAFQRQALAFPAGKIFQKDLLLPCILPFHLNVFASFHT